MKGYLLDTHAFIFWVNGEGISTDFIKFLDEKNTQGKLYVSTITFWEIALLVKKGRIHIDDLSTWKTEVLDNSNIHTLSPSISEMILSTELEDHHKDPFDRILIAQTLQNKLEIITKDRIIPKYNISTFWME